MRKKISEMDPEEQSRYLIHQHHLLAERNRIIMAETPSTTPFNKELFKALIKSTVEANPETFDMGEYAVRQFLKNEDGYYDESRPNPFCGSPACILGNFAAREDLQSVMKLRPHNMPVLVLTETDSRVYFEDKEIRDLFGLTLEEANDLFSIDGCGEAKNDKERAVRYLRLFYKEKTGEDAP